jgi:peptidoglycan/LPS O-acetylase OafA/YrhL
LLEESLEVAMRHSVDGSCIPYLLAMPVLILVAHLLASTVPFYRKLLAGSRADRYETLDGLRGLLATGVFFGHSVVMYQFHRTGAWQRPASPFYAALGELAVALFFMITGFLFWSRAISRGGRLAPLPLYWSRFWRIAPLYAFSAGLICLIVAFRSHFQVQESLPILAQQLLRVWSLGLMIFTELNGISTMPINASVTWTLQYEWLFYLALPLLAWLARPRREGALWAMLLIVLLIGYRLSGRSDLVFLLYFAVGMGTAHLMARGNPLRHLVSRRWLNLVPLAGVLAVSMGVPAYSLRGVLCGVVVFVPIVSGLDFWGLLRLRPMRLLGTVSYSIYLLHGIVLCLGLSLIRTVCPAPGWTPPFYWLLVTAIGSLVVCLSAVTYRWLEHPFLRVPLPGWISRTGRQESQRPGSVRRDGSAPRHPLSGSTSASPTGN